MLRTCYLFVLKDVPHIFLIGCRPWTVWASRWNVLLCFANKDVICGVGAEGRGAETIAGEAVSEILRSESLGFRQVGEGVGRNSCLTLCLAKQAC